MNRCAELRRLLSLLLLLLFPSKVLLLLVVNECVVCVLSFFHFHGINMLDFGMVWFYFECNFNSSDSYSDPYIQLHFTSHFDVVYFLIGWIILSQELQMNGFELWSGEKYFRIFVGSLIYCNSCQWRTYHRNGQIDGCLLKDGHNFRTKPADDVSITSECFEWRNEWKWKCWWTRKRSKWIWIGSFMLDGTKIHIYLNVYLNFCEYSNIHQNPFDLVWSFQSCVETGSNSFGRILNEPSRFRVRLLKLDQTHFSLKCKYLSQISVLVFEKKNGLS